MNTNQLDTIAELLEKARKITVFTGAGVSTNSGIPDFRGENGLYSYVQKHYNLPYPEAIFELDFFREDPRVFYSFTGEMMTDEVQPTTTHHFLAWLEKHEKISLIMTQNIDMLHQKAGSSRVFECHGTFQTGHCLSCNKEYSFEEFETNLKSGTVKQCSCSGIVKPDIVFFGETLPAAFFDLLENPPATDLVLTLGSSLQVQPAAGFILQLTGSSTPSILINLQKTAYDSYFNHVIHEDVDAVSDYLWEILAGKL